MTKENKLRIGLAINAIAIMSDKQTFDRIKNRLSEIEDIIMREPTDEEPVKTEADKED